MSADAPPPLPPANVPATNGINGHHANGTNGTNGVSKTQPPMAIGRDNSIPVPPADGNLSFVLNKIDDTVFEQREVEPPAPNQVQVNIRQTGICGSDCHYWKHGSIGEFVVRAPMVLGHESAGIVTAIGSDVTTHKIGDRVALEPGQPCGSCHHCRDGTYAHCQKLVFAATPPKDGTLATYYNLHAAFAHHLPDSMTLEEGSMMEPLAVAVQACVSQGKIRAMTNVVVFGAGPVGLLSAAVAKAMGAKRVVVVDIIDSKLEFALEFCATHIFKPSAPREGEEKMAASERNGRELLEYIGGDVAFKGGFDLVLECTGAPPCVQMGIAVAAVRARMVQVGCGPKDVMVPLWRINLKEIELVGTFRYGAICYPLAIELCESKRIDVTKLVTHRYVFNDALKAFQATVRGTGEDGKATIKVQISQGIAPPAVAAAAG